jgi:hypothetical protein
MVMERGQRRGRALRWVNRREDAIDAAARLVTTRAPASMMQRLILSRITCYDILQLSWIMTHRCVGLWFW